MSTHKFRREEHLLPSRQAIRDWFPNGADGVSAEDLDCSFRLFWRSNKLGTLSLLEFKTGNATIGWSKEYTFGAMDTAFRLTDPHGRWYKGYYVIKTPTDDWATCDTFNVNGVVLTQQQFRRWLWGDDGFLEYWLSQDGKVIDPDKLEAVRLAKEVSNYELVDIPPYQFSPDVIAKFKATVAAQPCAKPPADQSSSHGIPNMTEAELLEERYHWLAYGATL